MIVAWKIKDHDNSSSENLIPDYPLSRASHIFMLRIPRSPHIQGTTFPRHYPLQAPYLQAPYLQAPYLQAPYLQAAFLVPLHLFITMIS